MRERDGPKVTWKSGRIIMIMEIRLILVFMILLGYGIIFFKY